MNLWKNHVNIHPTILRRFGITTLLMCILVLGVLTRISGVSSLPPGHWRSNDAYLYQSQAETIAEAGVLPAKDMHRWVPFGRDNRQLLSLYAYALSYTHTVINFFHQVSLYQVQLYAPVVCFTIGFTVLLLFLNRTYGTRFAAIFGVLFATLPASIARTAAGFSDRDAWCWMLGILTLTSYLWKEQALESGSQRTHWHKYIPTIFCGIMVFLGGLSWEGFGIFVLIILSMDLWKFCTTSAELHLKSYCLWILTFVPWLYIISPAYRIGYGFSTHVTSLMLVPPITLLVLRWIRYLLLHFIARLRPYVYKLNLGLALFGIAAGIVYIFMQAPTFEITAFTFRESALMKAVSELNDPTLRLWIDRYGAIFILGSFGGIAVCYSLWKKKGILIAFALSLFMTTTFLRAPTSILIGEQTCDTLFFIALGMTLIGGVIATRRLEPTRNETFAIAMIAWFLLWGSFARHGIRYCFFISTPLSMGAALIVWHIGSIQNKVRLFGKDIPRHIGTTGLTTAILVILLFWTPIGGVATGTMQMAAHRNPIPGNKNLPKTYAWIKRNLLNDNTVVAAHWTYGSQLNVLAGVKTISDQDHYSQFQIHLYLNYVFSYPTGGSVVNAAPSLAFLKTHNVTHLMMTREELIPNAYQNSYIGSISQSNQFHIQKLQATTPSLGIQYSLIPQKMQLKKPFDALTYISTLQQIDVKGKEIKNMTIMAHFKNRNYQLPYVAFIGGERIVNELENDQISGNANKNTGPIIRNGKIYRGGILLFFNTDKTLRESYYIGPDGWESIAIRLFYLGQHMDAFERVYTEGEYGENTPPDIQIWKINYPKELVLSPIYLKTEAPPRYIWGKSNWDFYGIPIPQHATAPKYTRERREFERLWGSKLSPSVRSPGETPSQYRKRFECDY